MSTTSIRLSVEAIEGVGYLSFPVGRGCKDVSNTLVFLSRQAPQGVRYLRAPVRRGEKAPTNVSRLVTEGLVLFSRRRLTSALTHLQ